MDTFLEWRGQNSSFEDLACYHAFHDRVRYTLTVGGEPQRVRGVQVSQSFLDVLGVRPLLGRGFADEEGVLDERGQFPFAFVRIVDYGYLQTLRIPLLAGRYFDERDSADSEDVVIINETVARSLWPDENPIGKTALVGGRRAEGHTVIGVVADVSRDLEESLPHEMYLSFWQTDDWDSMALVVRSSRAPEAFIPDVRAAIKEFDPALPSNEFTSLDEVVDQAIAPRRLVTGILSSFSTLALALAAIGLYGVIAYSVSQRTREMGIRLAVGARKSDVQRLVIGEGLKLVGIGLAAGMLAAYFLSKLLTGLLFGVTAGDPYIYATNAVILMVVALLASWLPARRAAKVDPMEALRCE